MRNDAIRGILAAVMVTACSSMAVPPGAGRARATAPSSAMAHALIDEVAGLIRGHFYDPEIRGLDLNALTDEAHANIAQGAQTDPVIDNLLAALATSHTTRLTADQTAYYQLVGLFAAPLRARDEESMHRFFGAGPVVYVGVGWFTATIEGNVFVTGVLDGFPAERAGIRAGDEIVAIGGAPPRGVASFAGNDQRAVAVTVRRSANAKPIEVEVFPRTIDAATMFLDAMRSSARIIGSGGRRIAYVRPWSYAGEAYQQLLEELIGPGGDLAAADALVLDLRGGWGGADPAYLRPFLPGIPTLTMIDRDGRQRLYGRQWRKPLVLLADGDTRSGKEVLVWGARQAKLGTVVGTRTAGAVVAGSPFLLADGSLLYLAVSDVRVDGERLEGMGVKPDIEVPMSVRYSGGADPQLERAVEVAAAS